MWKKIETFDYPIKELEESRDVLLYEENNIYIGHYKLLAQTGRWETEEYWILDPTHWMELPEKPEDA